jgi:hypothetical protein|tara:strand:+ start:866 stop:1084 length:219 start_codon:yes stop_codon:yes gene_type:complete
MAKSTYEVTITVEDDEHAEKVLDVLGEAEVENELDFAFEVRIDRVESIHRLATGYQRYSYLRERRAGGDNNG